MLFPFFSKTKTYQTFFLFSTRQRPLGHFSSFQQDTDLSNSFPVFQQDKDLSDIFLSFSKTQIWILKPFVATFGMFLFQQDYKHFALHFGSFQQDVELRFGCDQFHSLLVLSSCSSSWEREAARLFWVPRHDERFSLPGSLRQTKMHEPGFFLAWSEDAKQGNGFLPCIQTLCFL